MALSSKRLRRMGPKLRLATALVVSMAAVVTTAASTAFAGQRAPAAVGTAACNPNFASIFYRASDGLAKVGEVTAPNLTFTEYGVLGFLSDRDGGGWTHIVPFSGANSEAKYLFYRAADGLAVTGTLQCGPSLV